MCPNQATADIAMAALGLYSTAMPEVSVKPLDTDSTSISAVCADDYVLAAVPPEPYPGPPGMFSTEFPDEVWFREPLIAPRPAPERLTGDLRLAAHGVDGHDLAAGDFVQRGDPSEQTGFKLGDGEFH